MHGAQAGGTQVHGVQGRRSRRDGGPQPFPRETPPSRPKKASHQPSSAPIIAGKQLNDGPHTGGVDNIQKEGLRTGSLASVREHGGESGQLTASRRVYPYWSWRFYPSRPRSRTGH